MSTDPKLAWIDIALTRIRQDICDIRAEVAKLHEIQEEFAKKEYAARIVGRIFKYAIRVCWYATIAIGGYVLTHWNRVKAFVEGDR